MSSPVVTRDLKCCIWLADRICGSRIAKHAKSRVTDSESRVVICDLEPSHESRLMVGYGLRRCLRYRCLYHHCWAHIVAGASDLQNVRAFKFPHCLFIPWISWRHQMEAFSRYWPFVRRIHRSPANSPHKGQWRGAFMFSLISTWTNSWANNGDAGDLNRHRAHYGVVVMIQ